MELNDRRFAVLIDADNVSPKYIKYILNEVSDLGVATYKRIYGDWTDTEKKSWKNVLLDWSVNPIQQYSYTTGKNSTDSAMIIDAMDILYSGNVDGFCLVSSDSDFTRLAQRLREAGMFVMGIGEQKTPKPFRAACDAFKILEIISSEDTPEDVVPVKVSTDEIEKVITKLLIENNSQNQPVNLAKVGNFLTKRFSDFDVRNYGYSKLSTFLESLNSNDLGQFTRNYTQTVKRAADNKRRYAPGWVHSTCLLRGFPKGAAPHLAHDFAEQSVVCYTLCRRCPENTVAAGEGKGI